MTPFGEILDASLDTVEDLCGVAITYRRGDLDCALPDATLWPDRLAILGRSMSDQVDGEQASQTAELQDFIVPRDFPNFGDQWREPEQQDLIEFVDPLGNTRQFVVLPLMGAEAAWRFTDQQQTRIRIHTKFLEVLP